MTPTQEVVALTKELVQFRTTEDRPDEIRACLEHITQYFSGTQVLVKAHEHGGHPSLYLSLDGRRHQHVLLNGHIDVVEGFDTQFAPYEQEGRLYGRGTYDMKASVATALVLLKHLAQRRAPPRLAVMVVSDEESGGDSSRSYARRGYGADIVIAGEPTRLQLETRHKGALIIRITAYGSSAHSSRPWLGTNAIEKLLNQYARIKKALPQATRAQKWAASVNPTSFRSESPLNVTPSKAEMVLDIRTNEEWTNRRVKALLQRLNVKYTVLVEGSMLMNTKAGNTLIKRLRAVAKRELGRHVKYIKSAGSSDMRFFSERGCTALNFGPLGANHHKHNEHVCIESLDKYYRILEKFANGKA